MFILLKIQCKDNYHSSMGCIPFPVCLLLVKEWILPSEIFSRCGRCERKECPLSDNSCNEKKITREIFEFPGTLGTRNGNHLSKYRFRQAVFLRKVFESKRSREKVIAIVVVVFGEIIFGVSTSYVK